MTDLSPATSEANEPRGRLSEAMDGLVESGFSAGGPTPEQRTLAELLALLDTEPAAPARTDLLINVTVARVSRLRDGESNIAAIAPPETAPMSAPSIGALDAIASNEWRADASDPRQANAHSLFGSLDFEPGVGEDERDALVGRTLDAIQADIEDKQGRFRMTPAQDASPSRARLTLSDLVSVAAMVLIAGAVFWPMVSGLRQASIERLCSQDLSQAGIGFAMYANDHQDTLPSREETANQNLPWWGAGESEASHSSNLFKLVRDGYATLGHLACPGNEHAPVEFTSPLQHDWASSDEISFSYQLFRGNSSRLANARNVVLLVDKSPIIARARAGEDFNPEARSLNHSGRGQNVLMSDLRVVRTDRPFKPGTSDNLWLPRHFEIGRSLPMTGREAPVDESDAFVVH